LALMGDFDYLAMSRVDSFWATVWFWSFMGLVLLVLLNMLLAIVMDNYTRIATGTTGQADTLWAQTAKMRRKIQETSGFLPLYDLICELEDDDNPAHPEERVTVQSLKEAFKDMAMTDKQARYLVEQTKERAGNSSSGGNGLESSPEEDIGLSDALRLTSRVHYLTRKHDTALVKMEEQLRVLNQRIITNHTAVERQTSKMIRSMAMAMDSVDEHGGGYREILDLTGRMALLQERVEQMSRHSVEKLSNISTKVGGFTKEESKSLANAPPKKLPPQI